MLTVKRTLSAGSGIAASSPQVRHQAGPLPVDQQLHPEPRAQPVVQLVRQRVQLAVAAARAACADGGAASAAPSPARWTAGSAAKASGGAGPNRVTAPGGNAGTSRTA